MENRPISVVYKNTNRKKGSARLHVCPECGGEILIWDPASGEEVCGECGLVVSEAAIQRRPEWRSFTLGQSRSKSRVGLPPIFSVHDGGLTTVFWVGRDGQGRKIPPAARARISRLRRLQKRSRIRSSVERNLTQAMEELDRLSDRLHVPPFVREWAALIYREAIDRYLTRGRSISAVADASLYAACRLAKTPRTLREIAKHSLIPKKTIAHCYRLLIRELNLRMPTPSAQLRVPKIAARVGVGERTQQEAVEILRRAEDLRVTIGKKPTALAAAALYLSSQVNGENQTQKAIAGAAGVTEATIRNRYEELKRILSSGSCKHGKQGKTSFLDRVHRPLP